MALDFNCISCNINQVIKIAGIIGLSRTDAEKILRDVLGYLAAADYTKCNPEIMGEIWEIIGKGINNNNPYKPLKEYYNAEIEKIYHEAVSIINASDNQYLACLKMAIVGNLVDYAAKHTFEMEVLKQKIRDCQNIQLAVDHSMELYKQLETAGSLLYLGDNCGEIVLDKIFIEFIKRTFPAIKVFYGVRGRAIVNDVTKEDAQMTGMDRTAEIVENGDGSLGTVIHRTSEQFKKIFYGADVIISKGQGNYESLNTIDRGGIFFLFMAKCEPMADMLGVKTMSIVCVKK